MWAATTVVNKINKTRTFTKITTHLLQLEETYICIYVCKYKIVEVDMFVYICIC